jgi:hypothetical protein
MSSPYYGPASTSSDFRGIGAHLLRDHPPITPTPPAPIDPTVPEFGSRPPPAPVPESPPSLWDRIRKLFGW